MPLPIQVFMICATEAWSVHEERKMQIFKFGRQFFFAMAIAYFGLASMAAAQVNSGPAIATTNVNMRVGPGTSYPVVTVLRPGDEVVVNRCRVTWCLVDLGRDRGWVSQAFLRPVISNPGRPDFGGRPPIASGQACFFENANFRGRSFCLHQGERERNLGRWENRINSITIQGRWTVVKACTDRNFRNCNTFTRDVSILNFMLQQNVSSVSVQ
jgi:uncharacterized protein YraI